MARVLTDMEVELAEYLYVKGLTWMARQPNGDLVAFKKRPFRRNLEDLSSRWLPAKGRTASSRDLPVVISKEKEDFKRIHRRNPQPTNVIDIAARQGMSYLWENEEVEMNP